MPTWAGEYSVQIPSSGARVITVEVWDQDSSDDDRLGTGSFRLEDDSGRGRVSTALQPRHEPDPAHVDSVSVAQRLLLCPHRVDPYPILGVEVFDRPALGGWADAGVAA